MVVTDVGDDVELTVLHGLRHTFRLPGATDSPHADFRAIADSHGRIMVVMTHNTDIGDSMEREGDDPAYFAAFSPEGYALATNIVLYALTR